MKLTALDTTTLRSFGREAIALLLAKDYAALAGRFGYALAYGREAAAAINEDVARVLRELHATELAPEQHLDAPRVSYFDPSTTGLLALVEYPLRADNGGHVLVELIATGVKGDAHLSLEDVSMARPNKSLERTRER